jgi:hypothetical protein
MAAAAFRETVVLEGVNDRKRYTIPMTVSDVADAFATGPDGNTFIALPADQDYRIVDVIVITGGTDTHVQYIFIGGLQSGVILDNNANLNTNYSRQFMSAPMRIKAGSIVKLKQEAA